MSKDNNIKTTGIGCAAIIFIFIILWITATVGGCMEGCQQQEVVMSEEEIKEQNMRDALEKNFPESDAIIELESYGEKVYPYGFKLHYFGGKIDSTPKSEWTWFLKYKVDVTNKYGATQKNLTAEATVTKDGEVVHINNFLVY